MKRVFPLTGLAVIALLGSSPALACATCFGQSDSALARGMNAGILFMLAVLLAVLTGLTLFFVHLGRRASAAARTESFGPDAAPQPLTGCCCACAAAVDRSVVARPEPPAQDASCKT